MSHSNGKLLTRRAAFTRPEHFEKSRPTVWGIQLGFHYGRGLSSAQIAHLLNVGVSERENTTSAETVRTMVQKAGLPSPGRRRLIVPLNLESWERDILQRWADEYKITVHELLYRFIKDGLVLDNVYNAVVDGRYDE